MWLSSTRGLFVWLIDGPLNPFQRSWTRLPHRPLWSNGFAPFPASGCGPPPPWSALSAMSVAFPLAVTLPVTWGLTPREHSSGGRRSLGRISKRGDAYLRMLLIHGARAVLWAAKSKSDPDRFRTWALDVQERRGHNKAATAVANKIARIVWAVWKFGKRFESRSQTVA